MQPIPEWRGVDERTFRDEIVTQYRPAVLKGLVKDWPVVRRGLESIEAVCEYLNALDRGHAVDVLMMPPHVKGRIFYNERMTGFNYTHEKLAISAVNDKLLRYAKFENRPSLAVQSALLSECLPGFANDHRLAILDESIKPRIWLGNAVVTPAHFDESSNIACVAAGKRRFTLLPPEQIVNLYIGPLDYAPTGTPLSMVSFREPDFAKFPRFRDALAAAQVAELEPGDAIYIPALWWHHVESLTKYNVLINYWWKGPLGEPARTESALPALVHSLLALRHLAPEHRAAWRAIFDHYVFEARDDAIAHIPAHKKGVLGEISPEHAREIKKFLVKQLEK